MLAEIAACGERALLFYIYAWPSSYTTWLLHFWLHMTYYMRPHLLTMLMCTRLCSGVCS